MSQHNLLMSRQSQCCNTIFLPLKDNLKRLNSNFEVHHFPPITKPRAIFPSLNPSSSPLSRISKQQMLVPNLDEIMAEIRVDSEETMVELVKKVAEKELQRKSGEKEEVGK